MELVTRYPTPQPERTNSPTFDLVASGQQSCPGATNGEAVQRRANNLRCGKVQTATLSQGPALAAKVDHFFAATDILELSTLADRYPFT